MNPWLSVLLRMGLFFAGLIVSFIPRKLELWLARPLGMVLFHLGRKRRRIAEENIQRCFPQLNEIESKKLIKKNFQHYGLLTLELLHLFSPLPGHYRKYCSKNSVFEGFHIWKQAHDKGKGVLFVASHLGNWELMAASGALNGIPITMVTKHLKPEWLHRKVEKSRLSVGVRAAYEPHPLTSIMRALKNKESVGFVLDQYAGPPIGILVQFFGVQVGTLAAVGTLAQRIGATVLPARTYRDEKGIVHVCVEPPLDLEPLKDEKEITQSLAYRVEEWVRRHPTQWLWIHRRFKNVVWPNV